MSERKHKPDFTVTKVWLTEDYREGLIDVGWQTASAGFGHLSFKNKDGQIVCSDECMGKEFVKEVLMTLVEKAVIENIDTNRGKQDGK